MEINLNFDVTFRDLYLIQSGQLEKQPQEILALINNFRKSLSFQWISAIKDDQKSEALKNVIVTILLFAEDKNTSIRLAAYSTIGTLIITVLPFSPNLFLNAFANAITLLPVSPKISIAIINSFMSFLKFISPVRIQQFVETMPILHHFSADVSDFIQFLPKTIPLMKKLPPEFQTSILNSLIKACGKTPNAHFSTSNSLLVGLKPKLLIPRLCQKLSKENLGIAAVWIARNLFSVRKHYDLIEDEYKEFFLSNAFHQLHSEPLDLSRFDYSCQIIAYSMRYNKGTDQYYQLKKRLNDSLLDNYTSPYRNSLLIIPCDSIELLYDSSSDPDSYRANKLKALTNYFFDHIDTVDADLIAQMMYSYINSKNDLLSTLIDNLSLIINELLFKCQKKAHIDLLLQILSNKSFNWVQNMKLVQLIDSINPDICGKYIPNYLNMAIDILIEFSLSPTDNLFYDAVNVLTHIASYETLPMILNHIYCSDWYSETIVYKRFYLLARLAKIFKSKLFSMYVGIAYECLSLCESKKTFSVIFWFLSKVQITYLPSDVRNFACSFVEKAYYSYAHFPIWRKSFVTEKFVDYDADIVSNPLINHKSALNHLKHCYKFLCNLPPHLFPEQKKLYHYSVALVQIFDKFALEMAAKLAKGQRKFEDYVWNLSIDTFKLTADDDVAASCANIFINDEQKILPSSIKEMLNQFIGDKCTENPQLLYLCFLSVGRENHSKIINSLPTVLQWLPKSTITIFLYKLVREIGTSIIPSIPDDYTLSILHYTHGFHLEYRDKVRDYINEHHFSDIPLGDDDLKEDLTILLNKMPKIELNEPEKLDIEHWTFIFKNENNFDLSKVNEYINNNHAKFSKIEIPTFSQNNEPKFTFIPVTNTITFVSTTPFIVQKVFVKSLVLIKNFAMFSGRLIDIDILNRIISFVVESKDIITLEALLIYSLKFNCKININSELFFHEKLIYLTAKLDPKTVVKHLNLEYEPSLIVNDSLSDSLRESIVSTNPNYFIDYFLGLKTFKKKQYMKLIRLFMILKFSIEKLSDLVVNCMGLFKDLSKQKQEVFIRFLTHALFCLAKSQTTQEFKSFTNFLSVHFSNIATETDASILNEFSYLFGLLADFAKDGSFFVDFLNTVLNCSSIPPLYLTSTALMISKKIIPVSSVDSNLFAMMIETDMPSFSSCAIRCLSYLKPENELVRIIDEKLELYKNNFLTVNHLPDLIKNVPDLALRYKEVFLTDPNHPCFVKSLKHQSSNSKVVKSLFDLPFISPEVISVLVEACYGKKRYFTKIAKLYQKFQRIDMYPLLLNLILTNSVLAAKLFFHDLLAKSDNFLCLFCFLRKFFTRSDQATQESIKKIIEMNADQIVPQSRFFSLMMLCEKEIHQINLGFIIAATESDTFSTIASEFDQIFVSDQK
ncbi:hypothetical protein TRFO_34950 [Tritrichomonas foetus]|uniref:Uncharacterized protein n=1 Tax=Tritrichomonas foetus TaxID=1144522 RepID=A0A1J4JMZ5_9EUKA|nr:hypothetical protein TRFO_34950 [Tritrichomonas foetus]|eukprot:OHS98620.1 hypothetical protein TRFO_34950 [Tritrichomonas foetus]